MRAREASGTHYLKEGWGAGSWGAEGWGAGSWGERGGEQRAGEQRGREQRAGWRRVWASGRVHTSTELSTG